MRGSVVVALALLAALGALCWLPGCLSQTHVIPDAELRQLAHAGPQGRGRRVRVIQGFASDDQPPEAPPVGVGVHVGASVPVPAPGPPVRPRPSGHKLAKASADEGAFWVVVAAAVAVGLAMTEGARFDGWVELHPMHPVHLLGHDGSYTWVPLAHLTPEQAHWTRKAMIRESEGPWRRLERAPLNRVGATYGVLLGSTEVALAGGGESRGVMAHIQLGAFFRPELGALLDLGMGFGEDTVGNAIFDARTALELQYLPLAAGKLHAGGFGQIGFGRRLDDGAATGNRSGVLAGAGGLVQVELTTRLAITGRAGIVQVYGLTTSDFTLGLSIY